jgi:hypothetical protein
MLGSANSIIFLDLVIDYSVNERLFKHLVVQEDLIVLLTDIPFKQAFGLSFKHGDLFQYIKINPTSIRLCKPDQVNSPLLTPNS